MDVVICYLVGVGNLIKVLFIKERPATPLKSKAVVTLWPLYP